MKTIIAIATLLTLTAAPKTMAADFFPVPVGAGTTNTNPYYYVGKLNMTFADSAGRNAYFVGSATVIKPYCALTAGHCVYSSTYGWLRSGTFERAKYYASVGSTTSITRMWVLGGYTSNAGSNGSNTYTGFSYDAGAVALNGRPGNGGYAGWWANTALLTNSTYKMSLGYGAANHDGQQMLRSAPSFAFTQASGAFFTNTSYRIEGGMSGGPVFSYSNNGWWVCAINVAGSSTLAGVHAVDTQTSNLIKNYLY